MSVETSPDPVTDMLRLVGLQLAESAFRQFGTDATEADIFAIERVTHPRSDTVIADVGGNDEQKLLAKIIIGHALRLRYASLCRSAKSVEGLRH